MRRRFQRQRLLTHLQEDNLEDLFIKLKTKLDIIEQLVTIFEKSADPQMQQQIAIARAELKNDIKQIQARGASMIDIFARIGSSLYKAQIFQAQDYLQALKNRETQVIDLVNEDQELYRRLQQQKYGRLNVQQQQQEDDSIDLQIPMSGVQQSLRMSGIRQRPQSNEIDPEMTEIIRALQRGQNITNRTPRQQQQQRQSLVLPQQQLYHQQTPSNQPQRQNRQQEEEKKQQTSLPKPLFKLASSDVSSDIQLRQAPQTSALKKSIQGNERISPISTSGLRQQVHPVQQEEEKKQQFSPPTFAQQDSQLMRDKVTATNNILHRIYSGPQNVSVYDLEDIDKAIKYYLELHNQIEFGFTEADIIQAIGSLFNQATEVDGLPITNEEKAFIFDKYEQAIQSIYDQNQPLDKRLQIIRQYIDFIYNDLVNLTFGRSRAQQQQPAQQQKTPAKTRGRSTTPQHQKENESMVEEEKKEKSQPRRSKSTQRANQIQTSIDQGNLLEAFQLTATALGEHLSKKYKKFNMQEYGIDPNNFTGEQFNIQTQAGRKILQQLAEQSGDQRLQKLIINLPKKGALKQSKQQDLLALLVTIIHEQQQQPMQEQPSIIQPPDSMLQMEQLLDAGRIPEAITVMQVGIQNFSTGNDRYQIDPTQEQVIERIRQIEHFVNDQQLTLELNNIFDTASMEELAQRMYNWLEQAKQILQSRNRQL